MPSGIRADWKKLGSKWNRTAVDFSVSTVRELADDPDPNSGTTSVLPAGGDPGDVLTKDTSANYDVSWQDPVAISEASIRYATLVKYGV